ncbi:hypothetical protein G7Y89_g3293 [Cudoniella acicularis]|uniref:alpha-galactosidase n=1 Tax=Cudoniella acicularis TaxID=354080 RepID=A0A8H4RTL8_9HELO|nr:hypothetical protein G7Y89_g3293 [Cudoniella acicularis]
MQISTLPLFSLFSAVVWSHSDHATTDTANSVQLWQPELGASYQVVLSLEVTIDSTNPTISPSVGIFEIDVFKHEAPTIALMHSLGKKVVCYFSAATAEENRPDYKDFLPQDFGEALVDWKGENYVNISSDSVWVIMQRRIKQASDKGCDAIEPDNTVEKLAREARSYNMSMGVKNCQEILPDVSHLVQFAINEECAYNETSCLPYANFTNPPPSSGMVPKPVFHVEYVNYTAPSSSDSLGAEITNDFWPGIGSRGVLAKLCLTQQMVGNATMAETLKFSTVIKVLGLDGWMMDCQGVVSNTATKD